MAEMHQQLQPSLARKPMGATFASRGRVQARVPLEA
jgi:hypothetical protein